jgi:hypothetical protein
MDLDAFARIGKSLHCPKCAAGPKEIFCGAAPPARVEDLAHG